MFATAGIAGIDDRARNEGPPHGGPFSVEAHGAAGLAPFESRREEDAVEPFGFRLLLDESGARHGKEAIVAILGKDEFFGEGCLIGQPKRLATAVAMSECVTMRVAEAEIIRVLREEPLFSKMFVSHILARSARIEEDLVDQLFNSTEKRLARLLLLLANFGKEGRPEPIIAKISQETLAEMIGTTRSRVSHFMNKFRKLGFIDYNGHLEVHSSLLSVVLNEQPNSVQPGPS
jgi:CRP/FNR family cyclic AMP-dependent transcriptional regulator